MPADAATPTPDGQATAIGIRALLIDDNPFDRELACRALRGLPVPPGPVELVCAGDWAEALPHLEAGGFDLVLLDYHLPGLMGLDILRELQGQAHPPVIMMTGQDDIATAVEILRAEAADYVGDSLAQRGEELGNGGGWSALSQPAPAWRRAVQRDGRRDS